MSTSSSSGISGFGSNFDWRSFVSQMVAVERQPQQRVRAEQNSLNQKREAIGSLVTSLGNLQGKAKVLSDANLFNARSVSVTNSVAGLATAVASNKALTGNFSIAIKEPPWKGASLAGGAITSRGGGEVKLSTKLSEIGSGLSSPGSLTINGKTVSLTENSTLADVITGINGASAGIVARFDVTSQRVVVTSTTSSDPASIALKGSECARLLEIGPSDPQTSVSATMAGTDLSYSIDGGAAETSKSPTLTEDETGLVGLSVTVTPGRIGVIDIFCAQDTTRMKDAITDFVDAYNKVQSLISTQTAITTNSDGKVTSGTLAFERSVTEASSKLRKMLTGTQTGAPANLQRLDLLGFTSNGQTNQITLADGNRLEAALKSEPDSVRAFFTASNAGLAKAVSDYAGRLSDSTTGLFVDLQSSLKKQASALDAQLANMERQALLTQDRLTSGFISLERVQAKLNQQLQYLQQRFQ